MGTLIFVCPATGHEVSTGVEIDRATFRKLSRTGAELFLSALSQQPCAFDNRRWLISDEIQDDSRPTKSAA